MRGVILSTLFLLSGTLSAQGQLQLTDKSSVFGFAYATRIPTGLAPRLPETFGGRSIPFDFDRDGDLDLLLTYGPLRTDTTGFAINRLYRNDGDHWMDITVSSGLNLVPPAANAAVGDYNGDGYPDLYLSRLGADILLRNDGGLTLTDVTAAAGISNEYWSADAKFFDANGDGVLDIFVANYLDYPVIDTLTCVDFETGDTLVCDAEMYDAAPNVLYLNDGLGQFTESAAAMGFVDTTNRSVDLLMFDADGDLDLELLVTNHFGPNQLFSKQSDLVWTESAWQAGLAVGADGYERQWKQITPLDANADGKTDLLFIDEDRNLEFMINDGFGQFFAGIYETGLFRPIEPITASLGLMLDADFDMVPDLMIIDARLDSLPSTQYILKAKGTGAFLQLPINIDLSIDTLLLKPRLDLIVETSLEDFLGNVSGPVFDRNAVQVEEETVDDELATDMPLTSELITSVLIALQRAGIVFDSPQDTATSLLVALPIDTMIIDTTVADTLDWADSLTMVEASLPPEVDTQAVDSLYLVLDSLMHTNLVAFDSLALDSLGLDSLALVEMVDRWIADNILNVADSSSFTESGFSSDTQREPVSLDIVSVWTDWDTVGVQELPSQVIEVDFDLDGISELLATYPSGLIKVWARAQPNRLNFVGLIPAAYESGGTALGAQVEVTARGLLKRFLVTNDEPIMIYPPARTRSVDVRVIWPSGVITEFKVSEMGKYYSLSSRIERLF